MLSAIVSSSDDAIIGKDIDGVITSWNRAAERIFGYAANEAIGQSIRLIVPPAHYAEEDDVLRRIRAGEGVDHYETIRRARDNRLVQVSLSVSPIKASDGTIIGASDIARDVTATKRLERDARHFLAIVASSEDAIISKNLEGTIVTWNRAAERMFGYPAAEIVGRSIRLIVPPDRQAEEDHVLATVARGDTVEHFETIRQRKDGTFVPISLTVSPIRDTSGRVIGASKIARDITDRVQADEERQRLLEIARSASHLKDDFLATLSHELRTPLSAIVGYIRLMQSGLLPPDKHGQAVETISRNATSLTQIVEDVLDVSRIVSGKLRLNVQPVELSDIVREAIATMQPAAEAKSIRVDLMLDPVATQVSGDPDRLRQVLWNLFSNGVKFTPRGGRVQIRLERVNSHVEVTVADNGIGIPAVFLPHLFERFTQADSGVSRLHGGLGLGLAICRHLVELQGGRISAQSPGPGLGSTFCVELPIRSIGAHVSGLGRHHPSTPSNDGPLQIPLLSGVRILVVDDDRDALALARDILEKTGAIVITADSGADALDQLHRGGANVLIADLGMPGMNGFDLIERIRGAEDLGIRDIPAAALTAFARSEDRARALRLGFEMHLSKPIEPGELMAAAAALARRRTIR
jgi:PAS domain S-box-containing protein